MWYIDVSIPDCCLSLQALSYAIFPTYSKFTQKENEISVGCNTRVEVRNDVVHTTLLFIQSQQIRLHDSHTKVKVHHDIGMRLV